MNTLCPPAAAILAPAHRSPPLSLTLMLILTGCSVGSVITVLVVGAVASFRNRSPKS